jgi:Flp pilus assembly protein TadG
MKKGRRSRGAALVEGALTLMVVMLFVLGIMDFGRAYNLYQDITNTAREGARYAVAPLPGTSTLPTTSDVTTAVNNLLSSPNFNVCPAKNCVTVTTPTQTINGKVLNYSTVTVTVPYTLVIAKMIGLDGSINIKSSATMRDETN